MDVGAIGRLIAAVLLGLALSGCLDANVEVELTSESTARLTMRQEMSANFYFMVKMTSAQAEETPRESFCFEGDLTEHSDGSATCVLEKEGPFAQLAVSQAEDSIGFTSPGPGLVRIALPTAGMREEIGEDAMDEETRAMIEAFFANRAITVRFAGGKIIETNMKQAADGQSAQAVILLLDIIRGTSSLPNEIYAVVRAP